MTVPEEKNTQQKISELRQAELKAAISLSAIERSIGYLRRASAIEDGKKMTEAHARAAFNVICDSLGMEPEVLAEKLLFAPDKKDHP